jgi:hypothetical protein
MHQALVVVSNARGACQEKSAGPSLLVVELALRLLFAVLALARLAGSVYLSKSGHHEGGDSRELRQIPK